MRRRLRRLLDRLLDRLLRSPYTLSGPGADGTNVPRAEWPWAGEPPLSRAELQDAEIDFTLGLHRAMYPRLYAPAEDYWRDQWTELCIWAARQQALANEFRRAWGLADPPTSTLPVPSLRAIA